MPIIIITIAIISNVVMIVHVIANMPTFYPHENLAQVLASCLLLLLQLLLLLLLLLLL